MGVLFDGQSGVDERLCLVAGEEVYEAENARLDGQRLNHDGTPRRHFNVLDLGAMADTVWRPSKRRGTGGRKEGKKERKKERK
jgi:hypothetical protein